ncbi:odorant receptor 85b-like [Chironomus tepperi]|uniref:odorant receptor 85b-like n=1 Tax=Chironomus tepperi TaxID=113505 RepID=UPI00391F28BC
MEVAAQALVSSYIMFSKYLPVLMELSKTLKDQFPNNLATQKKHGFHRKWKVLNYLVNLCMIIYFSCIDFFDIRPLFWMIYDSFMLQEVRVKLPFEMYCPFDTDNLYVYILMYLFLVWASYTIVLVMLCYDIGFGSILVLECIQFEILCDKIQNINPRKKTAKSELKECIAIHEKLIYMVNKTSEAFSFVMLHNILASTGVICVSSFLVVHGAEISLIWTFMEMLITGLLQIYIHCYYGEKLMGSSIKIAESLYNNKWYDGDEDYKKLILVMMVQSQRPQKINAFGFFDINFETLSDILAKSYSYFSLLKSMY